MWTSKNDYFRTPNNNIHINGAIRLEEFKVCPMLRGSYFDPNTYLINANMSIKESNMTKGMLISLIEDEAMRVYAEIKTLLPNVLKLV